MEEQRGSFVVVVVVVLFVSFSLCFILVCFDFFLNFCFGAPLKVGGKDMEGLGGEWYWGAKCEISKDLIKKLC